MQDAVAGQFYLQLTSWVIAIGMLSMAAAVGFSLVRKVANYRLFSTILMCLFFFGGMSRLFAILRLDLYLQLIFNSAAAVIAAAGGIVAWPTLAKAMNLPTYSEVSTVNQELHKANERLAEQQEVFALFLENNPVPVFFEDDKARLIYVNKAFQESLNVTRDEVIGHPTALWSPPSLAEEIVEQNREVVRTGKPNRRLLHFPSRPDGEEQPWIVVRFPVSLDPENPIVGAIGLCMESEYSRQALNSKLATIVESSEDAIIGKDLEGNITSWNRGAEELYGYSPDEVIGKNMAILIPPERMKELPEWLDKVKRGIRIEDFHTVRVCKMGDLKDVSESVSPIRDPQGRIVGAAVIGRDITVLKRQQAEINQLNDQLKKRVYDLAEANAALQSARDQALEASNLKSAFVANISHELRTPLAGILGLNEILISNQSLHGDDLTLALMVQESAQALLQVVNDILDLAKIEAGKISLEYSQFRIADLLSDCARLMEPSARGRGLAFSCNMHPEIPDTVFGDSSRLRQVLLNLIGNAIKFTEVGGIEVEAKTVWVREEKVGMCFSVKDTGIGISGDDQRFLFKPFSQVDNSSTRRFGGTGLGLAISRQFVEMMGGELRVDSEKGKGSTFCVLIEFDRVKLHEAEPLSTDKIGKPSVEPVPAELSRKKSVLIVEDNPVLQQLALRQMSTLGVHADCTTTGREAIQLAMSGRYSVIFMDINLPDISGLEATGAIRNLELSAGREGVPIIAMTAGAMKGDRERSAAAGMNDYLAKPVPIDQLKRMLEKWLAQGSPPASDAAA